MDASQIIKAFGGRVPLASLLGVGVNSVSMWQTNGIPARHCIKLAQEAEARKIEGITLEVLAATNPTVCSEGKAA